VTRHQLLRASVEDLAKDGLVAHFAHCFCERFGLRTHHPVGVFKLLQLRLRERGEVP
jgi:hypothetical protein